MIDLLMVTGWWVLSLLLVIAFLSYTALLLISGYAVILHDRHYKLNECQETHDAHEKARVEFNRIVMCWLLTIFGLYQAVAAYGHLPR